MIGVIDTLITHVVALMTNMIRTDRLIHHFANLGAMLLASTTVTGWSYQEVIGTSHPG